MKIRVIAIALAILAFFMLVGSPFQQTAQAIVGVDDAIITILIAAIAACGIVFATSGAFNTSHEYVQGLFSEYCDSNGLTPEQAIYGIDYGRTSLGKIVLNSRFVTLISGFIAWVKIKLGLVDNSQQYLQQAGYYLGNVELIRLPVAFVRYRTQSIEYTVITSDYECFVANFSGAPVFISNRAVSVHCTNTDGPDENYYVTDIQPGPVNPQWLQYQVHNPKVYYVAAHPAYYGFYNVTTGYVPTEVGGQAICAAIDNFDTITSQSSIAVYTGTITAPADDADYNPGDGAILDVGAAWGTSLPDIIIDTIPDSMEGGKVADPTITYDGEDVVQEEVVEAGEPTVSDNAGDYRVNGLASVFPFCIPFDIYDFFNCLAAEPVAPSFQWRFYVPGICDETITLDLSEFDTVAQIVRTMELLAFIVGLAFVTRDKMIKG